MRRKRETFDVLAHVPSNHFVQQLGRALDNRRLEHIARIRPDSSLTKADEDGRFRAGELGTLPDNRRVAL
jgi:hypothetical protein